MAKERQKRRRRGRRSMTRQPRSSHGSRKQRRRRKQQRRPPALQPTVRRQRAMAKERQKRRRRTISSPRFSHHTKNSTFLLPFHDLSTNSSSHIFHHLTLIWFLPKNIHWGRNKKRCVNPEIKPNPAASQQSSTSLQLEQK